MSEIIAAIMYDFDKTLSPKDMQEYAFIPGLGLTSEEFWRRTNEFGKAHRMDAILAYMYTMISEARGKMLISRDEFVKLGRSVELFDGVKTWFKRVNDYGKSIGVTVEHYIISSGLKEIIEGTPIAGEFKEIFASEFCYDDHNVPIWPAMAVNYTSKTQFLFRINKNVMDITEHKKLNSYTPDSLRRVPFGSMIYVGDGLTDVPCMKQTRVGGGHSIAVYGDSGSALASELIKQGRVNYTAPADYSEGSRMEKLVFAILDKIRADMTSIRLHEEEIK